MQIISCPNLCSAYNYVQCLEYLLLSEIDHIRLDLIGEVPVRSAKQIAIHYCAPWKEDIEL